MVGLCSSMCMVINAFVNVQIILKYFQLQVMQYNFQILMDERYLHHIKLNMTIECSKVIYIYIKKTELTNMCFGNLG